MKTTPSHPSPVQSTLAKLIAQNTGNRNQWSTTIPSLTLHRWTHPTEPTSYTLEPSICLIAQGTKHVFLRDEAYVYDANSYLITSVGLPLVANIVAASEERPYLGLSMEFDREMVAQLMIDRNLPLEAKRQTGRALAVSHITPPLIEAFERLLRLLATPEDIPILAPLIQKEIVYRLLTGEQGFRLRQTTVAGGQGHQITRAVTWLRKNYIERLRVEELAKQIGMSVSSFHQHFRELTAFTPVQYQKRLRLNEARRLMLTEHFDATNAALEVGYESPSQFSREYSRLFGMPPSRDIKSLQKRISQ